MLRPFGSIDVVEISEVTLSHPDGMEMRVLSWGAVIRDLVVPSPAGPQPVVLGLDSIDAFELGIALKKAYHLHLEEGESAGMALHFRTPTTLAAFVTSRSQAPR